MPSLSAVVVPLKIIAILVLIVAIAIPLRYRSTNSRYLQIRTVHSMLSMTYSLLADQARPTLSASYRAAETIFRMNPQFESDVSGDPLVVIQNLRTITSMKDIIPKPLRCKINKEIFEHKGHAVDTYWIDYSSKTFQRHFDKMIVYFHGGGYMLGDIESFSGFECHLSQLFDITILHVEYRLGPEHPLPAAVEDAVAVYRSLLRDKISPSQLILMGDSAGGGLALSTIQAIRPRKLPIPRGVIVLSPWADLSSSGKSHRRNRDTDVLLHSDNKDWIIEQVLGHNHTEISTNSPVYSPLFGSFKGFPPMYITVGTAELLEDDARRVVRKALKAGVNVKFEAGLHLMHVYPLFFEYYPEARNTLDNINKWLQKL